MLWIKSANDCCAKNGIYSGSGLSQFAAWTTNRPSSRNYTRIRILKIGLPITGIPQSRNLTNILLAVLSADCLAGDQGSR